MNYVISELLSIISFKYTYRAPKQTVFKESWILNFLKSRFCIFFPGFLCIDFNIASDDAVEQRVWIDV
jgi:hypothetical protein